MSATNNNQDQPKGNEFLSTEKSPTRRRKNKKKKADNPTANPTQEDKRQDKNINVSIPRIPENSTNSDVNNNNNQKSMGKLLTVNTTVTDRTRTKGNSNKRNLSENIQPSNKSGSTEALSVLTGFGTTTTTVTSTTPNLQSTERRMKVNEEDRIRYAYQDFG